ncbi:MAG TPA: alkaline phosphatase family protein [Thermoanaerobaculia bacterium]|nr:alkaline phosphatase family protein [Thermoanaerobaculia bacterium]
MTSRTTSPTRRRRLGVLFGALLLAAVVLLVVDVHDRLSREHYDYEPRYQPSAVDTWTSPWAEAAGDTAAAGDEPCVAPQRWLVVGWDAADWRLLLPLVEQGELPHLEHLIRGGAYGTLASFLPSISPALWTSVATGVTPADHGILGFYDREPRLRRWWKRLRGLGRLDRELYSNADRRVKAAWNLLSEGEKRVLVVGYHNTFPIEPVAGAMVSNYLVQDAVGEMMAMRTGGEGDGASGLVHPAPLAEELLAVQRQVQEAAPTELWQFAAVPEEEREAYLERARSLGASRSRPGAPLTYLARARRLDLDDDRRPYFLLRSYLFDTINARIAQRLYPRIAPDVAFVHFQSADWAAHQFLYFHEPERFAEMPWSEATRDRLEAEIPRYRDTVDAFYRYLDAELGRFLSLIPEGTAVMILSDHGVGPGDDPDIPGYHDDGPPGMIVLHGPGIRADHRLANATLYDVLPTLLASLDMPVADDLAGRVLEDAFCPGALPERRSVSSYQEGGRYTPVQPEASSLKRDVLEQLESLGYLD